MSPELVQAGLELPALVHTPTSRQLVAYAGASGDFNEIHYDHQRALEANLPGVIVHGLLKCAWVVQQISEWAGPDAFLRSLGLRYQGMDQPGYPYRISGRISEVSDDDRQQVVGVEISGTRHSGKLTTVGRAAIEIPVDYR